MGCIGIVLGLVLLAFIIWYVMAVISFPMVVMPLGIAFVVAGITCAITASLSSESRRSRIKDKLLRQTRSEYNHAMQMDDDIREENKRITAENRREAEKRRDEAIERKKQAAEEKKDELAKLKSDLAECKRRINECDIIGEKYKNDKVINYLVEKLEDNLVGSAREGLNRYVEEENEIRRIQIEGENQRFMQKLERERREREEWEQLERDMKTWDKQNEIIKNQEKILREMDKRK